MSGLGKIPDSMDDEEEERGSINQALFPSFMNESNEDESTSESTSGATPSYPFSRLQHSPPSSMPPLPGPFVGSVSPIQSSSPGFKSSMAAWASPPVAAASPPGAAASPRSPQFFSSSAPAPATAAAASTSAAAADDAGFDPAAAGYGTPETNAIKLSGEIESLDWGISRGANQRALDSLRRQNKNAITQAIARKSAAEASSSKKWEPPKPPPPPPTAGGKRTKKSKKSRTKNSRTKKSRTKKSRTKKSKKSKKSRTKKSRK